MTRLAQAFIAGGLVSVLGVLICVSPLRKALEESLGLELLFTLRGARPAPGDVVVVAIDNPTIKRLHLPTKTHKWPRSLHARLVDRLSREEPAVIVFDILFTEHGQQELDVRFAQALRDNGKVILAEYLRRESVPDAVADGSRNGILSLERVIPPIPLLEQASLGTAPFPLPKIPIRLNTFWIFKREAGDLPTLPATAFKAFASPVYPQFVKLAQMSGFDGRGLIPPQWRTVVEQRKLRETMGAFQAFFHLNQNVAAEMLANINERDAGATDDNEKRFLRALVNMYRRPHFRYLNFYGPPGAITTIPYHRVLETPSHHGSSASPLPALKGKAIFIGAASRVPQGQRDGFYTVYSRPDGLDLSGVEIAATAFANILEDKPVRPLPLSSGLFLIAVWGGTTGFVCGRFSNQLAFALIIGLSLAYFVFAYHRFATAGHWLPIVIPLLVQVPTAFVGSLICNYSQASRERRNIKSAFEFYLPDDIVEQLAQGIESIRHQRLVYGTCLFTDAQNYTQIAEKMTPTELSRLVNRYLHVLFEPVRRSGGVISDVKGDSILAIWPAKGPETAASMRACQAALEMRLAVDRFNQSEGQYGRELPTRMGIHAGYLSMGNVGAVDHYEYRPVGAAVNTAARLEALNKRLGTTILISEAVLEQVSDFVFRPLGHFMLAGKSESVAVYELIGHKNEVDAHKRLLLETFAQALEAFQRGAFDAAFEIFQRLLSDGMTDGPASFYCGLCRRFAKQSPHGDWNGTIDMV
jgi:adenylate cyclase